jgi:hypothetical protein
VFPSEPVVAAAWNRAGGVGKHDRTVDHLQMHSGHRTTATLTTKAHVQGIPRLQVEDLDRRPKPTGFLAAESSRSGAFLIYPEQDGELCQAPAVT